MTRRPPTLATIRALQRRERIGLWRYVTGGHVATVVTAPVIYLLLLPFVLVDLWVTGTRPSAFAPGYGTVLVSNQARAAGARQPPAPRLVPALR